MIITVFGHAIAEHTFYQKWANRYYRSMLLSSGTIPSQSFGHARQCSDISMYCQTMFFLRTKNLHVPSNAMVEVWCLYVAWFLRYSCFSCLGWGLSSWLQPTSTSTMC